MLITREILKRELASLVAQERQAFANFNAVAGARQQTERLLKMLDESTPPTPNQDTQS